MNYPVLSKSAKTNEAVWELLIALELCRKHQRGSMVQWWRMETLLTSNSLGDCEPVTLVCIKDSVTYKLFAASCPLPVLQNGVQDWYNPGSLWADQGTGWSLMMNYVKHGMWSGIPFSWIVAACNLAAQRCPVWDPLPGSTGLEMVRGNECCHADQKALVEVLYNS